MKIIYFSWSGVHSAAVAGALHLGEIPVNGHPSRLQAIPFFGVGEVKYRMHFLGRDQNENEIFSLGAGKELKLVKQAAENFLSLYGRGAEELYMINTLTPLGSLSRMGEHLASIGLTHLGNLLFLAGIKIDFPGLCLYLQKTTPFPPLLD